MQTQTTREDVKILHNDTSVLLLALSGIPTPTILPLPHQIQVLVVAGTPNLAIGITKLLHTIRPHTPVLIIDSIPEQPLLELEITRMEEDFPLPRYTKSKKEHLRPIWKRRKSKYFMGKR